jgi:energy-dependent translational throttle protein EttA
VGVIGPNGAGKSTLFEMITGRKRPMRHLRIGETVKLAYVDQNRDSLDPQKTIWEVISGRSMTWSIWAILAVKSRAYVARFNFTGSDQQKKVDKLSGGERNRVHMACMLKEGAT